MWKPKVAPSSGDTPGTEVVLPATKQNKDASITGKQGQDIVQRAAGKLAPVSVTSFPEGTVHRGSEHFKRATL